jgi:hypothetical protein
VSVRGRQAALSGLSWALTLGLVTPARAEVDDATRSSARELGYAGVEAFQASDYAAAHAKLDRAYRVLKAPSLRLWSARALETTGMSGGAGYDCPNGTACFNDDSCTSQHCELGLCAP